MTCNCWSNPCMCRRVYLTDLGYLPTLPITPHAELPKLPKLPLPIDINLDGIDWIPIADDDNHLPFDTPTDARPRAEDSDS